MKHDLELRLEAKDNVQLDKTRTMI